MGKAPCCDKANVKKGPWSPEEDAKLKAYIDQHGTGGSWIALPRKIGLKRCGKSCRLRWLNYLRPNIKHGDFSEEEDNIICNLYVHIGSRWSIIAAQLPGRTDNDIKNYWNTRLKKKLLGKQRKEQQAQAHRVRRSLKQEIKRETQNLVSPVGGVICQTPYYWPADQHSLPNPVANNASVQDYELNNIATATMNSQYSCNISFPQDQLYPPTMSMVTIANDGSICHPSNVLQGFGNFPNGLRELACVNPQQIEGSMGAFYGVGLVDMANGSTDTTTESTICWGDISSLVSDYEGCQQRMPRDVIFEESRYFGMQMQY